MAADAYDIEHIALDVIEQLGDFAAPVARELAVEAANAQDDWQLSAGIWRDIINTIERLLSDYGQVQWLTIH